jgi:hypothetical protein
MQLKGHSNYQILRVNEMVYLIEEINYHNLQINKHLLFILPIINK